MNCMYASLLLALFCTLKVCCKGNNVEPASKLAFGIMVYQKDGVTSEHVVHCFRRIFDAIYSPHKHFYVIHLDIKSNQSIFDDLHRICDNLTNCAMVFPRNVAWGGISTGEMMLGLMQRADESNYDWEYFVLLGHESIALTSIDVAENIIASYPRESNFVNCWDVRKYNFYGQIESNVNRIESIVVEDYNGKLIENISHKRKYPNDIRFFKSIQQMVLSRPFIKYVTLLLQLFIIIFTTFFFFYFSVIVL